MRAEHKPTARQLTRSVLTDTCPFALARTHFCLLPAQTNLILQQSRGRVDREPSRHLLPFTSYWPEGIAQVLTTGQVQADPLMLRSLQAPLLDLGCFGKFLPVPHDHAHPGLPLLLLTAAPWRPTAVCYLFPYSVPDQGLPEQTGGSGNANHANAAAKNTKVTPKSLEVPA